jgi:hypothetical protein
VSGGVGGPCTRHYGGVDVLGTGAQAVEPPSGHPSGERRLWHEFGEPAEIGCRDLYEAAEGLASACGWARPTGAAPAGPREHDHAADARPDQTAALARAYVAKMPPAVRGEGGDKQTYAVACVLVIDFALQPGQALPLMLEYNARCRPPWQERELLRKLEHAAGKPGVRGRLLNRHAARPGPGRAPAASRRAAPPGEAFVGLVPDFFQWDKTQVSPSQPAPALDKRGRVNRGRTLCREWVLDVVRHAVVAQRCSLVLLPDVYLAQLLWGPRRWPANWRQRVAESLHACHPDVLPIEREVGWGEGGRQMHRIDLSKGWRQGEGACYPACPLNGRPAPPHRHFRLLLPGSSLGAMAAFAGERPDPEGCIEFDFGNPRLGREAAARRRKELRSELKGRGKVLEDLAGSPYFDEAGARHEIRQLGKELRGLRAGNHEAGGTWAAYLPVRLFGPSPRVGLTPDQRNLITALTMQTTRSRRRGGRPDRAQVIGAGGGDGGEDESAIPTPPGLPAGAHVAFNGNASRSYRRHGYGFLLKERMRQAGYAAGAGGFEYSPILLDLRRLCGPFGLVAAGFHPFANEWKETGEMLGLCGSAAGRRWLEGCLLRVYCGADYLDRWRRLLAERMGFGSIPGAEQAAEAAPAPPPGIVRVGTAAELQALMSARGLTDGEMAGKLGVHRTAINHYRNGRRRWRADFQRKLDALPGRPEA